MTEHRSTTDHAKSAVFLDAADFRWVEPPGHYTAFTKNLVTSTTVPGTAIDFRVSRYPVSGRVDGHSHSLEEQLYYVISGTGMVDSQGISTRVHAGTVISIPPGVDHAIENTGDEDLVFAIVTVPPFPT